MQTKLFPSLLIYIGMRLDYVLKNIVTARAQILNGNGGRRDHWCSAQKIPRLSKLLCRSNTFVTTVMGRALKLSSETGFKEFSNLMVWRQYETRNAGVRRGICGFVIVHVRRQEVVFTSSTACPLSEQPHTPIVILIRSYIQSGSRTSTKLYSRIWQQWKGSIGISDYSVLCSSWHFLLYRYWKGDYIESSKQTSEVTLYCCAAVQRYYCPCKIVLVWFANIRRPMALRESIFWYQNHCKSSNKASSQDRIRKVRCHHRLVK
jgi:hypothetical protein